MITDDERAREAACDPRLSVLLQAPAGSGKTTVLTRRLLRLLCEVDEPEQILAITFTRKAAAEMRARVLGALRGTAKGGPEDPLAAAVLERSARRAWHLPDNPGRLSIQTIDAFNFRLASQLPLGARVGGALTVTDRADELYRSAARQTLLAAEGDRELARDTGLLFTRLDNQWTLVERLLADMLEKRAHWLRHVLGHDLNALCARIGESLRHLAGLQLAAACEVIPEPLRVLSGALPGVAAALGPDPEALSVWKRLAALTLTAKGEWRSARGLNRSLGAAYGEPGPRERLREVLEQLTGVPRAREILWELAQLPAFTMPPADQAALAALSRVLQVAAGELQAQLAHAGRVDHTYVGGAARAALADGGLPTDLALRIGGSLRHILVDELQDTSLAQLELLTGLTAGWEEGDGRSLFVVGDPMQSIYQFREAEVGLFLQMRDQGIGTVRLTPLKLTRNFRSVPALIQWCNRACAQLFPAQDDLRGGAVAFTESQAGRTGLPDTGVSPVRLALLPDRPAEAAWVAGRIAALREADPQATIAVLVAARGHAAAVLQALAARDVPALGVDLTPLKSLPVIQDLVALTCALHHPADRSAWLGVLRAPWCGLTLASLTALAQGEDGRPGEEMLLQAMTDPQRLSALGRGERPRLERVSAVLQDALAQRGRLPLADWLEQTWTRLGAPDAYPLEELRHARAFFGAIAHSAASGEWRGPQDLPGLLAGLYAQPQASGRVSGEAAGSNPVSVMTIHRAKGLEFDHVLLPGLERTPARDREPLLRWLDLPRLSGPDGPGDSDLIMAPVPALDGEDSGEVGQYLKRLTQRRLANEQARLLYVAITRARWTLHLSASPARDEEGQVRPRAGSLLARLWPVWGEAFERIEAPAAVLAPRETGVLRRLVAGWQPPVLPEAVTVSSLPPLPPERTEVEFSWVGETARHIGTVAHAALAQLAREPALPSRADVMTRCGIYRAQLRRLGVPESQLEDATAEVRQVMLSTLEDERGRWIFDPGHREAASELALTGVVAGRLTRVVIDRCFVDAAGTRWVLDFKTSRHEGGGLASFLDQEKERHRSQLTRYATLARGLGREPVRAALYYPLLKSFQEILVPGRGAAR